MDYILHRCSGTTFCSYAKGFQKRSFSILAHNSLLPSFLCDEVIVVKPHLLPTTHPTISPTPQKPHLSTGDESPYPRTQFRRVSRLLDRRVVSLPNSFMSESRITSRCPFRSLHSTTHPFPGTIKSTSENTFVIPDSIRARLETLNGDIRTALAPTPDDVFSPQSPLSTHFHDIGEYYFRKSGKLIRPTVILSMAGACGFGVGPNNEETISDNQHKIAFIGEMIHTASLVHDDVIDESDTRRNQPSVNKVWGNKKAILVGDYILARATRLLCTIGNAEIISILAQVIEDLVKGEFMQLGERDTMDEQFAHYINKTFKKTASLFAHSCKAVAALAPTVSVQNATAAYSSEILQQIAFEYGKNFGLAFQLIDDMLDFEAESSSQMGKPVAVDMKLGLATAPVLFAARQYPELEKLIKRRFGKSGDVATAWDLVARSDGLQETRLLAEMYTRAAIKEAERLPPSPYSETLVRLASKQIQRTT